MFKALEIVYEDADLLVVNKPSNVVAEQGCKNETNTLTDMLASHNQHLKTLPRCGLVHRLDKDTTGLLLVGKSLKSMAQLQAQFKTKTIKRSYYALGHARVPKNAGKIVTHLARCWRKNMIVVSKTGRLAITYYQVIRRFQHNTLLQCFLETGKTHQIRVHLQHLKHAIVGDQLYGPQKTLTMTRQALHAAHLAFQHPRTHQKMELTCALPADFQHLLDILETDYASIIR